MQEFTTRSIALVAALQLHGIAPSGIGRDGAGKCLFFFRRDDALAAVVDQFYADALTVPARAYASAMNDVRVNHITRR